MAIEEFFRKAVPKGILVRKEGVSGKCRVTVTVDRLFPSGSYPKIAVFSGTEDDCFRKAFLHVFRAVHSNFRKDLFRRFFRKVPDPKRFLPEAGRAVFSAFDRAFRKSGFWLKLSLWESEGVFVSSLAPIFPGGADLIKMPDGRLLVFRFTNATSRTSCAPDSGIMFPSSFRRCELEPGEAVRRVVLGGCSSFANANGGSLKTLHWESFEEAALWMESLGGEIPAPETAASPL